MQGLGTSNAVVAREYFSELDSSMVKYLSDGAAGDASIMLAFDKTKADNRKDWLMGYDPENIIKQAEKEVSVSDFINKELIHFSQYDVQRSIPSMVDGFKPSQRKVLYACMKKNFKDEVKVAQLSGLVSAEAAYHHGAYSTPV